ncbi:MAG: ABC transporter permease subunit [Syntrophobacterales bacterium]|jgi:ABC-type transport system involved in multi-copper enzyme maturation permease subunit
MWRQLAAFIVVALKGGVRDRVLAAILIVGLLLLLTTPVVAVFSMRQVVALATSYSFSIISLMGLLLTLFMSVTLLARDLEQRSVYTVCSLPISRSSYLLGKFVGLAILVFIAIAIMGCFSGAAILMLERFYPPQQPFAWGAFFTGLWFQYWVFLMVGAIAVLFTTVATSTFLPLALSVGIYFGSYSTEAVRYFVKSAGGQERLGPAVKMFGELVYWLLPNFSAFDLKAEVVYGLAMNGKSLLLTQLYGVGYVGIILVLAMIVFSRREFL